METVTDFIFLGPTITADSDWSSDVCSSDLNINNLRHADDTMLMAESEEELKSLLKRVKVVSEKAGLKLNIPITSWQLEG